MRLSTPQDPLFTEPDDTYFASGAWGSTEARSILVSHQLARDKRDGLVRKKDSKAFDMGHAWDDLLSTRKPFDELFIVRPEGLDNRTKEGKAWTEESKASGKRILAADEAFSLRMMLERMPKEQRDMAMSLPSQQIARVDFGLWAMQAKCDLFHADLDLIIDIKTTSSNLDEWDKSAFNYGYPFQSGWYRYCVDQAIDRLCDFAFLVTETQAPWRTAYFTATPDFLRYGMQQAQDAIDLLNRHHETGIWEDRRSSRVVDLPAWAKEAVS